VNSMGNKNRLKDTFFLFSSLHNLVSYYSNTAAYLQRKRCPLSDAEAEITRDDCKQIINTDLMLELELELEKNLITNRGL
jgi:hypothetical protein